jgi:proteasome lid subunit RPN8/RPN11
MTGRIVIALPEAVRRDLWAHLLPTRAGPEEAAFVYANAEETDGSRVFRLVDWEAVPEDGFASRSSIHFELTDEMRARVIKRAHDLRTSLIEFHSHTGPWPATFSPSDLEGFREFVPHVWWRLKGRPYAAVVLARSGFDGFAWIADPQTPARLDGITTDTEFLKSTGLSRFYEEFEYDG